MTFDIPCRAWTIINDSLTKKLKFKYNSSETFMELQPQETFSDLIRSHTVILDSEDSTPVPYRVKANG